MRRLRTLFALLLLFVPAFATRPSAVYAQGTAASTPESRLAALAERSDLDGGTKEALGAVLGQLVEDVRATNEWLARAAEFERLAAEAPERLQALQRDEPVVDAETLVGAELTLVQMEQAAQEAATRLDAAQKALDELRAEPERRLARRTELAEAVGRAEAALAALQPDIAAAAVEQQKGEVEATRHEALLARRERLQAEISCHRAELASYDARAELLPARRDAAQRELGRLRAEAEVWRSAVSERRQEEASRAEREVGEEVEAVSARYPELAPLAARNAELAARRSGADGTSARLDQAAARRDRLRADAADIEDRATRMRLRVRTARRSESMGVLLRREFEQLPDSGAISESVRSWSQRLAEVQYTAIELEDERDEVTRALDDLDGVLIELGIDPLIASSEARADATRLLAQRRDLLDALLRESNRHVALLFEIEGESTRYLRSVNEYRSFIEEHILWVRSVQGGWLPRPGSFLRGLSWATDPVAWRSTWVHTLATMRAQPFSWIPLALLAVAILLARPILRSRLRALAPLVVKHRTDRFSHTLKATLYTLTMVAAVPLVLWWSAGRLLAPVDQPAVGLAAGRALSRVALVWLMLSFLIQLSAAQGLALAHFRWPERSVQLLRRTARFFLPLGVVLAFGAMFFGESQVAEYDDSLGRASFVAGMAALTAFLVLPLRRDAELLETYFQRNPGSLVERTRPLWYSLALITPVVLGLFAVAGYYYTALRIQDVVRLTLLLVLSLVLVNALLLRWLFVERRHLAVEKARQRAAARAEAQEAGDGTTPSFDEEAVDIPAIDAQTKKIFRAGISTALVLGLYFTWSGMLPALRVLDRVQLWPSLGLVPAHELAAPSRNAEPVSSETSAERPAAAAVPLPIPVAGEAKSASPSQPTHRITLANLLLFLLILALVVVAARNLPGLLEITLLKRLPFDAGGRNAVSTIARYAIVLIGGTAAFGVIGIGWRQTQWLAAALTFGLAFGLQEIFANFVSGLIILLERPVRIGDVVTVGGIEGSVSRIRMRATTITDWDNRELLVPNREFITGQVINWTLTEPTTRLVFPIGVAYGSDTSLVERTLLAAAADCPHLSPQPKPSVVFLNFGDSSLNYQLRVYIPDRDVWAETTHWLNTTIDRRFREAGIEIPFPQRDVHLRGNTAALKELGD